MAKLSKSGRASRHPTGTQLLMAPLVPHTHTRRLRTAHFSRTGQHCGAPPQIRPGSPVEVRRKEESKHGRNGQLMGRILRTSNKRYCIKDIWQFPKRKFGGLLFEVEQNLLFFRFKTIILNAIFRRNRPNATSLLLGKKIT